MKRRIRDIAPSTPNGIKKWAEQRYEILRALREDSNLPVMSKSWRDVAGFGIDIYDSEDSSMIRITGGCPDRKGFLLTREVVGPDTIYTAHYDDPQKDGEYPPEKNEIINPLDGKPRPDPDPAKPKRTKNYKLPLQLRSTKVNNTNSGKFSGLMRKVVACQHLRSKEAPFGYRHTKTHGISKLSWTPAGATTEKSQYYIVEISAAGVYMAPVKGTDCCATAYDIKKYFDEKTESTLDLTSKFAGDPDGLLGIKEVLNSAEMAAAYADPPFQAQQGWAFPVNGRECQQTTFHYAGDDFTDTFHTEWSRWKIEFSADEMGVPSATITQVEIDKPATFFDQSRPWSPHGMDSQKWKQDFTLATDQDATAANFPSQDAPIHVYYDGDEEVVTRWHLLKETSVAAGVIGGPSEVCTGLDGEPAPPAFEYFCTHTTTITRSAKVVDWYFFGFYSSRHEGRVYDGSYNPGAAGDIYYVVDTPIGVGGTHNLPVGGTGPFPLVTFVISLAGSAVGISTYTYVRRGTFTGDSSIVMFIEDREACLHVYKQWDDAEHQTHTCNSFIELEQVQWTGYTVHLGGPTGPEISYPPAFPTSGWPTLEDLNLDDLPVNVAMNIVGPTNPISGIVLTPPTYGGNFPSTCGAGFIDNEVRTATGFLGVGPVTATANIPQGDDPTWIIPTNELYVFLNTTPGPTNFAESAIYALHGNVYYKRKGGGGPPPEKESEISEEFDNVAYLLQPATVVAENEFTEVDENDEVLAFVGKL